MSPGGASPVRDLASFAEALRGRGMTVTPDQMSDMARSLLLVDVGDRSHVYSALRCLAITDLSHRVPFDEEFQRFFESGHFIRPTAEQHSNLQSSGASAPVLQSLAGIPDDETVTQAGTSATPTLTHRDFAELDEEQLAEARQMVLRMLWEPSEVRTRRWGPDNRGRRPDLRRTLHGAVGPEGDLLRIERRRRRVKQRPLIIIADISGSMERYAEMFLVFAHAASHRLRYVEVFTFSTELTRITDDLARRSANDALQRASQTVSDWSGGTKIGDALRDWNLRWSRRLARGGPVVMVLSDGWDCGDPEVLSDEMGRLARSVHKVLWLNPLAARADYRPATQGMRAVLPHVDHLMPAASVADLRGVVRLLEEIHWRH